MAPSTKVSIALTTGEGETEEQNKGKALQNLLFIVCLSSGQQSKKCWWLQELWPP